MELKFCGIQSFDIARTLCEDEELRPRKLGFYCWQKERWGGNPITLEEARDITVMADEFNVKTILLMNGEESVDTILSHCMYTGVDGVQLTGPMKPVKIELLSRYMEGECGNFEIIKSMGVAGLRAIIEALSYATETDQGFVFRSIDTILLDSHSETQFGGLNRVNDWEASAIIVHMMKDYLATMGVWLAGGINEGNILRAMDTVQPAGIDIESGLKHPDGRMNYKAVARCIEIANDWTAPIEYY